MFGALTLLLLALPLAAQDPQDPQETPEEREASREMLGAMSLEELFNVSVVSASRKEQPLSRTAAAVHVIRGDDLRRLGVRDLAEALRLVPGVNVARLNGSRWAVSARGFNDFGSNKLQVLLDGRSLYTHTFSGVVWLRQGTFIEDIDRIEVIRGPGGATWGSNAINGVINIITKKADRTQGGLVYAAAGSELKDAAGARWGGPAGEDLHYRSWAMYANQDEQYKGHDDWFQARAGLRFDWTPGDDDTFMMTADVFDVEARALNQVATPAGGQAMIGSATTALGGHVLARWERALSAGSSLGVELSYYGVDGTSQLADEFREELQMEFSHRFRLGDRHDIQWGGGYRLFHDRIDGTFQLTFDPDEETEGFPSVFIQDEVELFEDRLYFTAGARFEYNDITGLEYQPTLRLSWTPTNDNTLWAAASRAVRTPSRTEQDGSLVVTSFPPAPTYVTQLGRRDRSEELLAFEAGWRSRPVENLSFDVSGFYNVYDRLGSNEPGPAIPPAPVVLPINQRNGLEGATYGAEVSAEWRPTEEWRLRGAYGFIRMQLDEKDGSVDTSSEVSLEGSTPRNQASIWSSLDILDDFELDVVARYVDVLPAKNADSYLEFDARLGWYPVKNLELAIVGQNLARSHHEEFGTPTSGFLATEVERGFYFYIAWRF